MERLEGVERWSRRGFFVLVAIAALVLVQVVVVAMGQYANERYRSKLAAEQAEAVRLRDALDAQEVAISKALAHGEYDDSR